MSVVNLPARGTVTNCTLQPLHSWICKFMPVKRESETRVRFAIFQVANFVKALWPSGKNSTIFRRTHFEENRNEWSIERSNLLQPDTSAPYCTRSRVSTSEPLCSFNSFAQRFHHHLLALTHDIIVTSQLLQPQTTQLWSTAALNGADPRMVKYKMRYSLMSLKNGFKFTPGANSRFWDEVAIWIIRSSLAWLNLPEFFPTHWVLLPAKSLEQRRKKCDKRWPE